MKQVGQDLYRKAKSIIPGGTQLLSKRPEMFLPDFWPSYYKTARGCKLTDLDGNEYIDTSYMGIGSCILGYSDEDVNAAVKNAVDCGNMATLNVPEEVELAELLLKLHPWADKVRYQRSGGEAMAVAVRIARAYTKEDIVLFCGYHGWHDWYLAANLSEDKALDGHLLGGLEPNGVPRGLTGTALPFQYNDVEGFETLVENNKGRIGAIVLEPIRNDEPTKEFYNAIHEASSVYNIPIIADEITAGFRLNNGGAHLQYGLKPDIAVFAKAISNGFPMAAVIGNAEVMAAAQTTFISSTYWTDKVGPAAALQTLKKMEIISVQKYIVKQGMKVQSEWKRLSEKNSLDIHIGGMYPLSHFDFLQESLVMKTLFTQLMLEKGYLASTSFYISYAHTDKIIDDYIVACDDVFYLLSKYLKEGNTASHLRGPVCHSGFQRLN